MVGLHDDCGNLPTRAVGALCDYLRNLHEIFVPSRTRIFYGGFLFHVAYFSTFSSLCVAIGVNALGVLAESGLKNCATEDGFWYNFRHENHYATLCIGVPSGDGGFSTGIA